MNGKLINYLISMKIGFLRFFGLLIMNPPLHFQNARWWKKNKKISNVDEIWYMGVFDVAYYEFNNESPQFKMADRVRRTKGEKLPNFNANWYLTFFGVAD